MFDPTAVEGSREEMLERLSHGARPIAQAPARALSARACREFIAAGRGLTGSKRPRMLGAVSAAWPMQPTDDEWRSTRPASRATRQPSPSNASCWRRRRRAVSISSPRSRSRPIPSIPPHIDETPLPRELPARHALRLAEAKARAGRGAPSRRLRPRRRHGGRLRPAHPAEAVGRRCGAAVPAVAVRSPPPRPWRHRTGPARRAIGQPPHRDRGDLQASR